MPLLRAVTSTGAIFLAILLLSVDLGVFAEATNVGERGSTSSSSTHSSKRSAIESIGNAKQCNTCMAFVEMLQKIFQSHFSENLIADVITAACKKFHIEDDYICTKIVQEFKVWHGWRCSFALARIPLYV